MKNSVKILLVLAVTCNMLRAQNGSWIEGGITGTGGIGMVTSKNIFNDQRAINSSIAPCYGVGLKLAVNINEYHEILFNPEYSVRDQKYAIKIDSVSFKKDIKLKLIDFSLLYRYHNRDGGYVEIGPQLSMMNNVMENKDGDENDVTSNFNKLYMSGVFGFGSNFIQSNAFTWTAGIRFNYSFTDLISGSGGSGSGISYPLNDVKHHKSYDSYTPTKVFSFTVHTEFNFDMGYFARSNCKRKRVSFLSF